MDSLFVWQPAVGLQHKRLHTRLTEEAQV